MQLKVITKEKVKPVREIEIGELVLCEDGNYLPVKSKLLIATTAIFYRLSNGLEFHTYSRILIKTPNGFKLPDLWEPVTIDKKLEPVVVSKEYSQNIMIICDILIDGNVISPEGVVLKYGDN
jgi:hypothetical protein